MYIISGENGQEEALQKVPFHNNCPIMRGENYYLIHYCQDFQGDANYDRMDRCQRDTPEILSGFITGQHKLRGDVIRWAAGTSDAGQIEDENQTVISSEHDKTFRFGSGELDRL